VSAYDHRLAGDLPGEALLQPLVAGVDDGGVPGPLVGEQPPADRQALLLPLDGEQESSGASFSRP
jgi:hypothetical protein